MKTLIELYDDVPIENVLATEMFRPEETVLLCPPEVSSGQALKTSLEKYFAYRNCPVRLKLVPVSLLDAEKVEARLKQILAEHPDCAIDISGGTDAALFAAGAACGKVPVFTYARKKNTFFEIRNAPFARNLPCTVRLDARACFLMAGGTLLPGRGDSAQLKTMLPQIDRMFAIYGKYRRGWNRQIAWFQKVSSSEKGILDAGGPRIVKADRGMAAVMPELLNDLHRAGLIEDLRISEERAAFRFPDETVRFWLRDIGAALELQVFRACLAAECFDDVVLSAVVNWEGGATQRNAVTNEIDVVAVQGIRPVFISCKTGEIKTEALNELSVLRDRFGGKGSRAIIVTSAMATKSRAVMRLRAQELNIEVVEWNDLLLGRLSERLRREAHFRIFPRVQEDFRRGIAGRDIRSDGAKEGDRE